MMLTKRELALLVEILNDKTSNLRHAEHPEKEVMREIRKRLKATESVRNKLLVLLRAQ